MVIISFLIGLAIGTVFSAVIFKLVAKARKATKDIVHEASIELDRAKTRI